MPDAFAIAWPISLLRQPVACPNLHHGYGHVLADGAPGDEAEPDNQYEKEPKRAHDSNDGGIRWACRVRDRCWIAIGRAESGKG